MQETQADLPDDSEPLRAPQGAEHVGNSTATGETQKTAPSSAHVGVSAASSHLFSLSSKLNPVDFYTMVYLLYKNNTNKACIRFGLTHTDLLTAEHCP